MLYGVNAITECGLVVLFMVNTIVDLFRYFAPVVSSAVIEMSPRQGRLLGVKELGKCAPFYFTHPLSLCILTLVLLNCLFLFFTHLKMEFPAPN